MLGNKWPLAALTLLVFGNVAIAQAPDYIRTRDVRCLAAEVGLREGRFISSIRESFYFSGV